MSVLVDTSVWSLVLRRKTRKLPETDILSKLISEGLVNIIGPIRQELLSGIADKNQFDMLKERLHYFPDILIQSVDFVRAAEYYNICRKKGIQGSHTDFLICSIAHSRDLQIYTTDKDFLNFKKVLPIKMFR